MAFPTVVGRTSGTSNSGGNTTNHVINLPAGVAAGDLILVLMNLGTSTVGTITPPAGFDVSLNDVISSVNVMVAAFKTATGSEGSSVTFTTSGNTKDSWSCYVLRNWSGTPEKGTLASATSTACNPPSLSPSWGAADTFWIAAAILNTQTPSAIPANYSNQIGAESSSGSGCGFSSCERQLNAATEDPGSFTITSTGWKAQTYAVRPVATIFATLTKTDAADTITTAAVHAITGTLTRVDAADTMTVSADLFIAGSFTRTEANDTLASTSALAIQATLDVAEAADTLTADGASAPVVEVTGSLDVIDAPDTLASDAILEIRATLSAAEASDTFAATGALALAGTLSKTDAADTLSSASVLALIGSLSRVDAADTLTGLGNVLTGGALVATDAKDTLGSAGVLAIIAAFAGTDAPDTLAAFGALALAGTLTQADAPDTLEADAISAPPLFGFLNWTDDPDELFAFSGTPITAFLTATEANDILMAEGTSAVEVPRRPAARKRSTNLANSPRPAAASTSRPANLN